MNDVFTWPVGREADHPRAPAPAAPVFAYMLAAGAGGATAGLVVGLVGERAFDVGSALPVVATAVLAWVALTLQLVGRLWPLPQRKLQVPRRWLLWHSRKATAVGFGFMIGSGALVRLEYAAAYLLAAVVLVSASTTAGLIVGAAYGLTRGGVLGLTWVVDRLGRARPWHLLDRFRLELRSTLGVGGSVTYLVMLTSTHGLP